MKKIPTIFERDWDGDRSRVLDQPAVGCEWVFAGEGVATRKLDGTSCMVKDGKLYKRRELRGNDPEPPGIFVAQDETTGKRILWVEVGEGPEDRWHREAWDATPDELRRDGTYELIGPKIQRNFEGSEVHALIPHSVTALRMAEPPRTYDGLCDFLTENDNIEGIVFHHPDGRMAKIKGRDFGIKRKAAFAT